MTERFAPIAEFDGKYLISDHGRVRRAEPFNRGDDPYEIKAFKLPNGYWQVGLRYNGKKHMRYVHRLVAEVFIPNPDNLPEVNHKFGDKDDNRWTELEWSTRHDNNEHKNRILLSHHNQTDFIVTHPSGDEELVRNLSEFCERHGLTRSGLGHVVRGFRSHHKGFKARYAQKETSCF